MMSCGSPRIWLIIGDKLGDNAQVDVLVQTLGLPAQRKELRFKEQWVYGKPRFRASLHHIDPARSAPLEPPWPDLVITIGRRPAMAALWVKRQSGGRTKLVLIGRPKRHFDEFDLVIATGQYRVPERPNVLKLDLPLMRADPEAVAQAVKDWEDRLSPLPRPLTAVFVGGATKPFRFGASEARQLLKQLQQITGREGSLYISTSRRTAVEAVAALGAALPANARLFRWRADTPAPDNPYLALLGSADRFVVTGDSISMMVEVIRLGKPLAIAPLPRSPFSPRFFGRSLWQSLKQLPLLSAICRGFDRRFLWQPRDFDSFYSILRRAGWASFLGEGFPSPPLENPDWRAPVTQRLQALLPAGNVGKK